MWLADNWKEYQVLDVSDGEKLERWGTYILRRPDPQVIWKSLSPHPLWEKANGTYHRSASGGGSWTFDGLPESWTISYGALTFRLKPFKFKHTGLFPEQAVNWDWMQQLVKDAHREVNVLNLFAYTGGATLALAHAGAKVVHVDAAKGMVDWAKENAAASNLQDQPVRWLVDDCFKFVKREIRRGHTYDAIVMDPPSFGRGPGGEIWKLENSLFSFLQECAKLLSRRPLFVLLNSYTTGLQPLTLDNLLRAAFEPVMPGKTEAGELGLPVENSLVLPCGASARMTF